MEANPTDLLTTLHVNNTLTKQKEEFKPLNGNEVTWYMCGPTVYSDSHLGHAKTYICFDAVKRILRDYFKYDIKLVMNITDIDDKIIKRSIDENTPFDQIARKYETEYLRDMERLNIESPTVLTRVSEYIPEIVEYIQKIIDNGYAYESQGSVYFDVPKFSNDSGHNYAKLDPSKVKDPEAMKEGEGILSEGLANQKRSPQDFALWKAAKENEAARWDSPWGQGRPGWHIECSAMANAVFKSDKIDIHSGGVDLKFPHHDNEIAQAEAYSNCDHWVYTWMHSGHLNIKGQKMSKSLKNFVTIKDFLDKGGYNHREMRFLFLLNQWDSLMNYNPETSLNEPKAKDKQFANFFRTAKAIVEKDQNLTQKFNDKDFELEEYFRKQKKLVHHYMCDNFNTPGVIQELSNLVSTTSIYMGVENTEIKAPLINDISKYVLSILNAMGFIMQDDYAYTGASASQDERATAVMNLLSEFRSQVKSTISGKDFQKSQVFKLTDKLRDQDLLDIGVLLEDRDSESIWSFITEEEVARMKREKAEEEQKAEAAKAAKEAEKAKQDEVNSTPPEEFFKKYHAEEYSQFDESGKPTHDANGEELTKSGLKKVEKTLKAHMKKHEKWFKSQK